MTTFPPLSGLNKYKKKKGKKKLSFIVPCRMDGWMDGM
jgi:hypothetical protein